MMFQSLFAQDFPLRGCTYLLGLILNAQNAASGGSRLENDVPFKLPGTRHGRRSLVALEHAEINGYCL